MEGKHSPTRSVQTRASEKHTAAVPLDASKRRRTISASMRKFFSFAIFWGHKGHLTRIEYLKHVLYMR